jgi:NADPH:quinone reductase-like Zn-dependent oxidoreductase
VRSFHLERPGRIDGIVAVGEEVTRFQAGDRVIGGYWPRWLDGRLRPDGRDQLGCNQPRPVIGRVFEFAETHDAFRHYLTGDAFGKVIIRID